ncbi:MAG: chemotaxis protein CheC [Gemmatimonadota bacterium]|nr:chemotaxis protein CheC [Gemmatimonadota bacterium]
MQNIKLPEVILSSGALRSMSPARLDALKEVANIGAGHAATALSLMTGARIMIDVPTVNVGQLAELVPGIAAADVPIVGVMMDMHGSLSGQTLLALPVATARRLADLMLRRERRAGDGPFNLLEESALREAGNILGGAYMTALSEFLEMQLMPSPPRFRIATTSEIMMECVAALSDDIAVCCVETEFSFEEIGERFRGFFLLLPDSNSFSAIFRAVRLT